MMSKKYVIADWLVHGGHQYEFFKTSDAFFCTNPNGSRPSFQKLNRPRNYTVKYLTQEDMLRRQFNIVMVRAGVRYDKIIKHISKNKAVGIAVIQTHTPFKVPKWVRCVVWNSEVAMAKFKRNFPGKHHFYIPHGFDPCEFNFTGLDRNGRVLTGASYFKRRGSLLGFSEWNWLSKKTGLCDVVGHGNPEIPQCVGNFSLDELVKKYNQYSIFLNTTTKSAMPRVRGEALMCGTPVVTTKNYGIEKYLVNKKSCLYADTKEDMHIAIKNILESKSLSLDLSSEGRAAAIKYFHINEYKARWQEVFFRAVR